MRGGGDRDQLARDVEARLGERVDDVREERRVDLAHVERDRRGAGALEQVVDRQRDLVARRELVDEALAVGVEQPRALAADRLGDEEALATGHADHGGRVELEELEVGEQRAGAMREQHARCRATPAGWSCAPTARRRRRRRSRPRASARRARRRSRSRRSARRRASSASARACSTTSISGSLRRQRRELAHDAAAGRAAAGVHDAPARVAALEPERERAVALGVEVDAETLEVVHALRRLGAQHRRGRAPHQPAAGAARCRRGGAPALSSGGERRRETALRPVARGLGERRRRDQRDARPLARQRTAPCRAPRRPLRRPRARPRSLRPSGIRGYRTAMADRSSSAIPRRCGHDTGRHPECAARIVAIERAPRARSAGTASSGATAPRVDRALLERCHDPRYVAALERLCAAGRRPASTPTRS